ncbi:hypothetical protein FQA39_LY16736 [Lamprigera yunnana]|nr:hypothetical protein FQA39_LY16736 [Lamprigera yunnana]
MMHACSNLKEILSAIEMYIDIYESDTWLNSVTVEDIKGHFKLSKFVEDTVTSAKSKNCVNHLMKILILCNSNKRKNLYDVEFFLKACDHLLEKFLLKDIPIQNLDVAIRMFTSMFSQQRLESSLFNTVLMSSSVDKLINYTIASEGELANALLDAPLLLRNAVEECNNGRKTKSEAVLTVLLTDEVSEEEKWFTDFALKQLYTKMDDRSILSKHFWLALFNVDKMYLCKICVKRKNFFQKLIDFIIYIGCMMNREIHNSKVVWVGDSSTSICPDMSYSSIIGVAKVLSNYDVRLKECIENHIMKAKESSGTLLWDEFLQDLRI